MILTHRPVPFDPNQGFGANATQDNPDPTFGNYQPVGHLAVDFGCPEGTDIVAAAPGTVAYAGLGEHMPESIAVKYGYIAGAGGWASGIITIIDHGDGTATAYSHQSEIYVTRGQWVDGGQHIGDAGTTGRSTGPHLHFEYMTLPINYGSPYYSRSDPMKQFGAASTVPLGNTKSATKGFLMALTDEQQTNLYNRIMGGIPAGEARTPEQIGNTNPPRLADSGDIYDLKQLVKKTLNTEGGNVLLAAIAEAAGKTVAELTKRNQAIADVDRQFIPDRLEEIVKDKK